MTAQDQNGGSRFGYLGQDVAGLGMARLPKAGRGAARPGAAWYGAVWPGEAGRGEVGLPKARRGQARCGVVRRGTARHGRVGRGAATQGAARQGGARLGLARLGAARHFHKGAAVSLARHRRQKQHTNPAKGGQMQHILEADGSIEAGGTALILHNERLLDPLDSFTQAIAAISGKRRKTIDDHTEIAVREFVGGLYTEPTLEWPVNGDKTRLIVPGWNIIRCLEDEAKRTKRGKDVRRGVSAITTEANLSFDGNHNGEPVKPMELWRTGDYAIRKGVGIGRSKTMRTRPMFTEWRFELAVEIDSAVFDSHTIAYIWQQAGIYTGIGELRPVYGKFCGRLYAVGSDGSRTLVAAPGSPPSKPSAKRKGGSK